MAELDCLSPRNSGFATEAVSAVLDNMFEQHNTQRFEALVDTRNFASQKLLTGLGFKLVATIKNADFFKGISSDEHRYVLHRRLSKES